MAAATQLLRLLVRERLTAAAEEIFGLVEQTIAEIQDEVTRSKRENIQLKRQLEQLTLLKPQVILVKAEDHSVSEEPTPPVQRCDVKVEQTPVLGETESTIQEHPQVKEEQVDQCISPDVETNIYSDAGGHPKSEAEPSTNRELLLSTPAVTGNVNESANSEWKEGDGSSSHGLDVFLELEQPPRGEKFCRFCRKRFKRDAHLIRHVDTSHKGHKAFKCLECNKEFQQRFQLIVHIRIHTGEKPFSCDFCQKTFSQNSSRIVHMRMHTGEKPYFCKKCDKWFTNCSHIRRCSGTQNKTRDKSFRCTKCGKTFYTQLKLNEHMDVHESWRRHISEKRQGQMLEEKEKQSCTPVSM